MKIKNKTNIKFILVSVILMLGLFIGHLPTSAANSKIIVYDTDSSGTISIGDEFCLESECFYVIGNANGELRAMAKYNLYVGANYDKMLADIDNDYTKIPCTNSGSGYRCDPYSDNLEYYINGEKVASYNDWLAGIANKYGVTDYDEFYEIEKFVSDGSRAFYNKIYSSVYEEDGAYFQKRSYKFYPYVTITDDMDGYALQNPLALGVTGEKGNANYPIYATTILFNDGNQLSYFAENLDNFVDGYTNFEFTDNDGINVTKHLSAYSEKLNNMGFDVSDVDLINVKELNDIVHEISGQDMDLAEWFATGDSDSSYDDGLSDVSVAGDIKQYVGNDYSWLWGTSYWTKTLFGNVQTTTDVETSSETLVYFVSTQGDICYSESGCWASIPRAGIRPIITMDADDFDLNTFDINGTVRWIDDNNADNVRPVKSTIKLYRNGVLYDQTDVTKDDDEDVWRFSFSGLTKYDEFGDEYVYTITQDDVPLYTSNVTDFNVVNRYSSTTNPNTGDISQIMIGGAFVASVLVMGWLCRRSRR